MKNQFKYKTVLDNIISKILIYKLLSYKLTKNGIAHQFEEILLEIIFCLLPFHRIE